MFSPFSIITFLIKGISNFSKIFLLSYSSNRILVSPWVGHQIKYEFILHSKKIYSNIEKSVLGLGVYEMKYLQTPPKVVINEYINLVKAFGPKESFAFINGILDKVSKSL